jgi:hypothetical protein
MRGSLTQNEKKAICGLDAARKIGYNLTQQPMAASILPYYL